MIISADKTSNYYKIEKEAYDDLLQKSITKDYKKSTEESFKNTTKTDKEIATKLSLEDRIYKTQRKQAMKPNDCPTYIHKSSNHPPTIIKNIPESVNKRLCDISANEEVFNGAIPPYQAALKKSGYDYRMKYIPPTSSSKKRSRGRKITWFNPPYSLNVATNVGAKFLKIVDHCFPTNHPLHKIMNRNTLKISYRCMPNMSQNLAKHNAKVSMNQEQDPPAACNCRGGPMVCPLGGACQTRSVVYQAAVLREDNNTTETYTGLTSRRFKDRYYEHRQDMASRNRKGTSLSNYIWKLKSTPTPFKITWKILSKCKSFNPTTKKCNLCLKEKYFILFHPEGASLNDRNEVYATCRHRLQPLLGSS